MGSKRITVSGATGTSGNGQMRHLLQNGWTVRAVTRDADSDKARAAAAAGAELAVADLNGLAAVRKAIKGADAVYLAGPSLGRCDIGGRPSEATCSTHAPDNASSISFEDFKVDHSVSAS